MEHLAYSHFNTVIEINFIEMPQAKAIFDDNMVANTLIPLLSAFVGTSLTPRDTLIFLDEIQECPRARTALKFLVKDGRFDSITTKGYIQQRRHTLERTAGE